MLYIHFFKRFLHLVETFGSGENLEIFLLLMPSEVANIKSVMQEYGETTEQQKAVGTWLCDYEEHLQPFDEIKHRHTLNEVDDVANGAYDWKIN